MNNAEIHRFLSHKKVNHFTEAIQQVPLGLKVKGGGGVRSLFNLKRQVTGG